jgi:hypothetical protein
MCDYSLMGFPNRLAVTGEVLVVHRFPTNSLGLISPSNLTPAVDCSKSRQTNFWATLKSCFKGQTTSPVVAVCLPPGSKLVLHDIPAHLRDYLKVSSTEEVTFTQLTANAYAHRDAIRFANGCELPLQHLIVGQRVKVLTVSLEEHQTLREALERHNQAVA